jgi:hypothetical protein
MRFRPRFSVRALAIAVTLVCVYFATWGPTSRAAEKVYPTVVFSNGERFTGKLLGRDKRYQELCAKSVNHTRIVYAESPAPLFITQYEQDMILESQGQPIPRVLRHYIWLIGLRIRLPFDSTWSPDKSE